MQGEGRVGQWIDQAIIQHEARAMMAFLAGLEHELNGASQLIAFGAQHLSRADEHRDVGIVTACVHRAFGERAVFKPGVLMERKRIHIAAQQYCAAIRRTFEGRDEASGRWPLTQLQRKASKRSLNLRQRFWVLETEFRLGMDRPAQVDKIG